MIEEHALIIIMLLSLIGGAFIGFFSYGIFVTGDIKAVDKPVYCGETQSNPMVVPNGTHISCKTFCLRVND